MDDETELELARQRRPEAVPRGAGAAILQSLALGEKTVTELARTTGLSQPNVSNHLGRLRSRGLVSGRREGRQIIYRLASAGLGHLVLAHGGVGGLPRADIEAVAAQFLDAVLTLREEEAVRVVDSALATGLHWKSLYLRVLSPALVRVGELWERGELTVSAEHLISGIILRLLHRLSLNLPVGPSPNPPSAVVGCVEGELHTIGGRMMADFLIAEGWRVWYLNGYLPLEHLTEAVDRHRPDAVVVCITTPECREALGRTGERLGRWRGERSLPLLVTGGRYFGNVGTVDGFDVVGTDIEAVTEEMRRRVGEVRGAPLRS